MKITDFRRGFLLLGSLFYVGSLSAQSYSIQLNNPPKKYPSADLFSMSVENTPSIFLPSPLDSLAMRSYPSSSLFDLTHTGKISSLSERVIPAYARNNPSGYTYLCQMELQVEKNLPIPLWIRAGKIQEWETYNSTAMYLQVKVWGFRR